MAYQMPTSIKIQLLGVVIGVVGVFVWVLWPEEPELFEDLTYFRTLCHDPIFQRTIKDKIENDEPLRCKFTIESPTDEYILNWPRNWDLHMRPITGNYRYHVETIKGGERNVAGTWFGFDEPIRVLPVGDQIAVSVPNGRGGFPHDRGHVTFVVVRKPQN